MDKYKLTVTFDDGDVITETFKSPLGMHNAMKWWKDSVPGVENKEAKNRYKIVSLEGAEI